MNQAQPAKTGKTSNPPPVLTISSKNYSSWSLRGWLVCRIAGLEVEEQVVSLDDPDHRAELLLLAPSMLVPRLNHDVCSVWGVLAIGEYLAEIRARYPDFKVFAGALADIERIETIWTDCIDRWGGPFLFGKPTMADAMFAPVCTRFETYEVALSDVAQNYCRTIMSWAPMTEWIDAAKDEPDDFEELDIEF